MSVLQLRRRLSAQTPVLPPPAGFRLRHYSGAADIPCWLDLRGRAFAGETPPARPWSVREFERELLSQPWWQAERLFVLEADASHGQPPRWAGSAILAERSSRSASHACVHWLMVDPLHRRLGLARWLLSALARAAWERGFGELRLETHSGWAAALTCYREAGFVPASGA